MFRRKSIFYYKVQRQFLTYICIANIIMENCLNLFIYLVYSIYYTEIIINNNT